MAPHTRAVWAALQDTGALGGQAGRNHWIHLQTYTTPSLSLSHSQLKKDILIDCEKERQSDGAVDQRTQIIVVMSIA